MRTRSAHDTKRLFRRFLSTTSSTSALALYPIRTLIRFYYCLWRLARIPQNDTLLLTYVARKIRASQFAVSVCRSVPFRRFFPRMSTSGWQTGRPRRRPRVALGCLRGDVRRGRARVAPARRAVPSGRPVDVVVRPERHGTPRGCRGSVASVAREAGAGEGGGGCARGEGAGARSLGDIRRRLIRAE